ncbi:hypothetical protein FOXB_16219 [Fusarium oxysporum f. sp. conglutinans Fo5176]|uniref:Endonuclease/exonuclease/phosphatase domain-containing protein n=1 Tax=Fusarium oxysporum (strain Fo5176) TaxID=660025 RepID=F9GC36_FUSOF|nr:hypothetical protein FOXB_16219 [Fusarium oxysporum f. sp. conglutinans Fo5176]
MEFDKYSGPVFLTTADGRKMKMRDQELRKRQVLTRNPYMSHNIKDGHGDGSLPDPRTHSLWLRLPMHHIAAPVCIELVELAVDQLVDYVELFGSLVVDMVIAGDFNRHDQLWGGEDVSLERQGEADQIIGLMTFKVPDGHELLGPLSALFCRPASCNELGADVRYTSESQR